MGACIIQFTVINPQCGCIVLIRMAQLFLDGVACLGKTSVLHELCNQGIPVGLFDFHEYYQEFKKKDYDEYRRWLRHGMEQMKAGIFDRTKYSSNLYDIIHNILNGKLKFEDSLDLIADVPYVPNTLVFLPMNKNYEPILKRMVARNNGLDVLTTDYVEVQTQVFTAYARTHFLDVVFVNQDLTGDDCEKHYREIVGNIKKKYLSMY